MDKGFQVEASVCFASLWLYFDGYAITDAHVPHEKLSILIMLICIALISFGVSAFIKPVLNTENFAFRDILVH